MASTVKHLRSSTANKRPTASGLADGQLGINTASGTPGVFFKDSAGTVVKVGPAHVGASAPNATPAGSAGNSLGELWVNNSTTINGLNYYTGSAFVNLTPSGTTTVAGLVELATDAETQTGTDTIRAVTPSGLQSKISDSTSTTSSTTIASATAVKAAYDLANAALPKTGGRVTGNLEIGPAGSLSFEGSSDDGFETTFAVVNPTADRTITFPNVTGNVVTTGDSGTVTSTMIANSTIVDADISASAAIAPSKLGSGALSSGVTVASANIIDGTIVNADVNASAAIAGTKISPNFGSQDITIGDKIIHDGDTNTAIRFPAADTITFETDNAERARIDSSGRLLVGTSSALSPAGITPQIQLEGTSANAASMVIKRNSDDAGRAILYLAKSRGTSNGSNTIVQDNDILGSIEYVGADGSGIASRAASISCQVDGTPGSDDMPGRLVFSTTPDGSASPTERMRIDSQGRVGIGTTSPGVNLHVQASGQGELLRLTANDATGNGDREVIIGASKAGTGYHNLKYRSNAHIFDIQATERARIDSSGRLLVGTSSATATNAISNAITPYSQIVGTAIATCSSANVYYANNVNGSPVIQTAKSRGTSVGSHVVVQSGDRIGAYSFAGSDGTAFIEAARIDAFVDGTPGANDMPGRLVFSTTADGSATPTERMRIDSQGRVGIGTTSPGSLLECANAGGASANTRQVTFANGIGSSDFKIAAWTGVSTNVSGDILGSLGLSFTTTKNSFINFHRGGGTTGGFMSFTVNNDSEAARIDGSGRLLAGTSSAFVAGGNITSRLQLHGTDASDSSWQTTRWSANNGSPINSLQKSRGASVGTRGIVLADDDLGGLSFSGDDGTNFVQAATIKAAVDGTPGSNNMPGRLVFSTTANGAATTTERMRIDSAGNVKIDGKVGIGGFTGNATQLNVTGDIPDDGQVFAIGVNVTAKASTSTSSIYGFISDIEPTTSSANTVTGLFRYHSRQLNSFGSATVTNQYGFLAESSLTGATNNYGFHGGLASATGRWNFYAGGNAPNYFAGDVRTNTAFTARTAPANSNTTTTATASSLKDGLRTGTPTGNIDLTLPTGTNMDAAFQELQNNQSFEWSVINLAAATHVITVVAASDHTVVGNMAVAANSSGRFITRKTAANTFISYRIA